YYGANRVGDDLFANSLLALKAETGERVWHFQFVRHDIWDRDLPAPANLVSLRRNGRRIDAVAQITKSGHVFVFERETGKLLFPIQYRRYPPSDVEGEVAADSQPLPLVPEPFARQRLTEDMLTDRTPEHIARCWSDSERCGAAVSSSRRACRARSCSPAWTAGRNGAARPSIRRRRCCTSTRTRWRGSSLWWSALPLQALSAAASCTRGNARAVTAWTGRGHR